MADHAPDTPTASFAPPPTTTAAFAPSVPAGVSPSTAETLPPPGSGTFARSHLAGHRFTIGELIARGGMGEVYRAADRELDRKVAVKVLAVRLTSNPLMARRFLNEARLCGRLQHPGIVPVYALGELPDGRPFFAMKLVEGETLARQLAARATPHAGLPRFLQIFEQVCQAVGYAHSQGVIHRDLKPDNVMVGTFGEVQVMDWGLARQLRNPERGARTGSEPEDTGGSRPEFANPTPDLTQHGSVMGTPAFMPPEQAAGDPDRVDRRADVFGLGGVLCVILTGKPPYVDSDTRQALASAARGDLADAFSRLDACEADAELIALCKRCLSANPDDRPADAAAVAAAISDYRACVEERARLADLERAKAEARSAAERKRRKMQLVLVAVVALSAAVTTVALRWYAADREREASAARARRVVADTQARTILREAWEARRSGWLSGKDPELWADNLRVARHHLERLTDAEAAGELSDELLAEIASARAEVEADDRLREFAERLEGWNLKVEGGVYYESMPEPVAAEFAGTYLALFSEHGLNPAEDACLARAAELRDRSEANDRAFGREAIAPQPILDPLLDAFDTWERLIGVCLKQAGGQERWGGTLVRIEELSRRLGSTRVEELAGAMADERLEAWVAAATPRMCRNAAVRARAVANRPADGAARELRLRRLLLARDPTDFRANLELAYTLMERHTAPATRTGDRARLLQEASRLFAAATIARPGDSRGHIELANCLLELDDRAGAEASLRRAVALSTDGFDERTEYATFLCQEFRFADALPLLSDAVDIARRPDQKMYLSLRRTTVELLVMGFDRAGVLADLLAAQQCQLRFDPSPRSRLPLAATLQRMGREAEAVGQYELALADTRASKGQEVEFATDLGSLAEAYRQCGRYADANATLERARSVLGSALPELETNFKERASRVARDRDATAKLAKPGEQPADRALARAAFQAGKFELAAGILARYLDRVPAHIPEEHELRALARAGATDARWRDLARTHLRKQLADCKAGWYEGAGGKRVPMSDEFIADRLGKWLVFPDLAGIRDEDELKKLPAAEQAEWRKLWADVCAAQADVLKRLRRVPADTIPPAAK